MAGPWEKYQKPAASAGPWDKYKTTAKAAPSSEPDVSRIGAAVSGFERGLKPVADIARAVNPLSYLQDAFLGTEGRDAMERQLAAAGAQAQQARPNYFAGGKLAGGLTGGVAAGVPVSMGAGALLAGGGRLLGAVAPRAGQFVQRIGQATQTGGIGSGRTATQTSKALRLERLQQLGERAAGGAIAGATGAAVTGEDVGTGAAFGAGLPVLASVLKRVAGVVDLTKLPRLKAAEIIRQSLGENVDKARAALAQLSPNDRRIAELAMLEAGVTDDAFYGLGKMAQEQFNPTVIRESLESGAAARKARLDAVGGGGNVTARRAASEAARRDVSEQTAPARNAALEELNYLNRDVSDVERLAAEARANRAAELESAAEQSDLARRMTFGAERAETRLGQMDDLGDAFDPAAVGRERGIAGAMTQRGEQAALGAIGSRQKARDLEDYVADLTAQSSNIKALRVGPIAQKLRSMAAQPGTEADDLQRNALTGLAEKLEGLADEFGLIDSRNLYQIRKSGLDDIVENLLKGVQPSSGTKKRAASLLMTARGLIDDAGGPEWRDFIDLTNRGFMAVNRQQLGAEAAKLAETSPNKFINLMRGGEDEFVENILGSGQYDIGGLALADPQRYLALKQSADEMDALNRMKELRSSGSGRASDIIYNARPNMLQRGLTAAVAAPFPTVRIAAQGAQQVERAAMSPRVQREIGDAYASGQNMQGILNEFTARARASEAVSNLSPGMRNALAQLLRGGTMNNQ